MQAPGSDGGEHDRVVGLEERKNEEHSSKWPGLGKRVECGEEERQDGRKR